ncbi:MAG TPA: nickel pincer cofactor biosynthesis protein LarC [Desulfomonilia bacterium]
MKALIFDPVGGASGDMILASLIELGCPVSHIQDTLELLGLGKPVIRLENKKVNGVSCLKLDFEVRDEETERSWRDIRDMINSSGLAGGIAEKALDIFGILASAEARVHGVATDDVHFHEVGAVDSIFDIVGISAAIDFFKPDEIFTTPLPLSTGTVESRHGTIPVPAPATLLLIEGLPSRMTDIRGELVTPTGAAVIKALAAQAELPGLSIISSGYGCGAKTFPRWPNMFRSILCEASAGNERVYVIESDIDDMIPEDWDAAGDKIREAGAIDLCLVPCIMKEGRPGNILRVLSSVVNLESVCSAMLQHTTTIGVRYYPVERRILERRVFQLDTAYGKIRIKEVVTPDGSLRRKPEYKDMKKISEELNIPVQRIRDEASKMLSSYSKDGGEKK